MLFILIHDHIGKQVLKFRLCLVVFHIAQRHGGSHAQFAVDRSGDEIPDLIKPLPRRDRIQPRPSLCLAFIGQSGIGAVAIPAVLQSLRLHGPAQEPHDTSGLFAPPLRPGQLVSPAYAARLARTEPGVGADDFFDRPPFKQFKRDQLSIWQRRLGRRFEIGTLYTVIAGMLNVLVVLDAFVGPLRTPSRDEPAEDAAPTTAPARKA